MSRGKYSPTLPHRNEGFEFFKYNAKGEIPPEYVQGSMRYDPEIHFADHDEEGYDYYGYSSYDAEGKYVGCGAGVDRNGYTETDYLCDEDLYNSFAY